MAKQHLQSMTYPSVSAMGMMLFDPIWSQKMHLPCHNDLLCVTDGQVVVRMRGSRLVAGPGDMILIPEGTRHRDDFDVTSGLRVFMVYFSWDLIRDYCLQVSPYEFAKRANEQRNKLAPLVAELQSCHQEVTDWDRLATGAWVLTILMCVWQASRQARGGRKEYTSERYDQRRRRELMQRAKLYLDTHFNEPVFLDQVAKALGISPFYLSHLFTQENGFSMVSYLTGRHMHQARRLLQDGRHNVSETAYAVGYNDRAYFCKVFRRYFGCPPHDVSCPLLLSPKGVYRNRLVAKNRTTQNPRSPYSAEG